MFGLRLKPFIETERLLLRPPEARDAAAIAANLNDFSVSSMLTRAPYPYDEGAAEAFIDHVKTLDPDREQVFVMEHKRSGPVGVIGFSRDVHPWPELGYWLGRAWWGEGLATEAARAALHWAKTEWGKKVVGSGHFASNAASAGVLIKAGFLYTGEVRQRESLARGEPQPTRMMVWLA
jgi:RimJ/RimL family protein N-acetyltransferase